MWKGPRGHARERCQRRGRRREQGIAVGSRLSAPSARERASSAVLASERPTHSKGARLCTLPRQSRSGASCNGEARRKLVGRDAASRRWRLELHRVAKAAAPIPAPPTSRPFASWRRGPRGTYRSENARPRRGTRCRPRSCLGPHCRRPGRHGREEAERLERRSGCSATGPYVRSAASPWLRRRHEHPVSGHEAEHLVAQHSRCVEHATSVLHKPSGRERPRHHQRHTPLHASAHSSLRRWQVHPRDRSAS